MESNVLLPEHDSVLNYYALPLVGLNKGSFGEDFIRTYINKAGTHLFVKLRRKKVSDNIAISPHFYNVSYLHDEPYIIFVIPAIYYNDVRLMIEGKYSKMSLATKDLIRRNSGLPYKQLITQRGNQYEVSSPMLVALNKSVNLLMAYKERLGLSQREVNELIVEPDMDLVSSLTENDFIETYMEKRGD